MQAMISTTYFVPKQTKTSSGKQNASLVCVRDNLVMNLYISSQDTFFIPFTCFFFFFLLRDKTELSFNENGDESGPVARVIIK